jgi:hypothetical protein
MAIPKIINAQRDFSAGELDESTKRADELGAMKAGAREMLNWRILSSKSLSNRPGRSALFILEGAVSGRIEEFVIQGTLFYLGFASGALGLFSANGTFLGSITSFSFNGVTYPLPWTAATMNRIIWVQIGNSIYIAYSDGMPNNVPLVLNYNGSFFTVNPYMETIDGAQKRTLFYRISSQGVTLRPSGTTGNINISFSDNVLVSGMVGTRLEYCGRQLTIKSVSSGMVGTATANEALPPGQILTLSSPSGSFNIGDEVKGSISGATGIVTTSANSQQLFGILTANFNVGDTVTGGTSGASGTITQVAFYGFFAPYILVSLAPGPVFVNGETATDTNTGQTFTVGISSTSSATTMTVQILPTASGNIISFTTSDQVVGPSASSGISAVTTTTPQAVTVWDDEVMNQFRGYPSSVFADQTRLGFANFPSVPSAIAWSALGQPNDLLVGALPDDAIFELAPDNSQVFYVIPGMESSEFVFTDRAIYYIPIGGIQARPLEPGSVQFNKLSDYGVMPNVQPRRAEQSIIYIKAGGVQVGAVQSPGAYYRPYVVDHISELHSHLFTAASPIVIAVPSGPNQFEEQYIYILRSDGIIIVGHYAMRQGLLEPGPEGKPAIGWVPWYTGGGTSTWIAARQADVIFTTNYAPGGVPVVSIAERLDAGQFLDGALLVNALPPTFVPPTGKGPLFGFPGPNSTVFLIDGGRPMGIYNVDANGFIVPQFIGGENLASATLVAGQNWNAALELWMPGATPGQSARQRTIKRRVSHMAVDVSNSTGFVMVRQFAGPLTPTSPALGAIMNTRRVPAYNLGDDATQPPPLREEMQRWRPLGRAFDPRVAILKDTPGSLLIHEIAIEVTI